MATWIWLAVAAPAWASEIIEIEGGMAMSTRNTPLETILELSAVVIEGPLEEVAREIRMVPVQIESYLVWRVQVAEELLGHVEADQVTIVIPDEFPSSIYTGRRVLLIGNVQTLYWPTYTQGRDPEFAVFPAYEELLVPTVRGSLFWEAEDWDAEDGSLIWSGVDTRGVSWLPAPEQRREFGWSDLVDRVRQAADECGGCGNTVAGYRGETR